jgi:gamma-glutamyltranspeptidase/glutathione hydrolase
MEGRPGYPSIMTKLRVTADASRIYLKPDGSIYDVGDRLFQPEMANTIQRLADAGGEDFYTGEIARMISKDFDDNDGFIVDDDLRNYAVLESRPLIGHYRGFEIRSTPFSSNGPSIIQMLHILEHFDLSALGHNSPEYIDTFARIQRAAFVDNVRLKCMGHDEAKPLEQQIISLSRADYWADRVKSGDRLATVQGELSGGTTHLTCIDAERNIVSFTHSIGSVAGSGVITPGLGFLYNNFLGHYNPLPGHPDSIVAGKRFGGGVPTIVFKDDEPIFAVGAPGGSRLITSTVQSIVNVIDHGMDMGTAVSVPRFHSEEQQLLFIEPTIPLQTARALQAMGNDVQESTYMSRVQAIRIRPGDKSLEAGADPRGGAGVGYHLAE